MNEIKQPLADLTRQSRGDNSPSFEAKQNVNDSTGKVLAIISFGLSCLAIGAVVGVLYFVPKLTEAQIDKFQATLDINSNRAQVSENHWRDIERDQKIDRSHIEDLKQEIRNERRR